MIVDAGGSLSVVGHPGAAGCRRYIRCIKPNDTKKPAKLMGRMT